MARSKMKNTKYEILQCATKLFLEKGYTDAYVTVVAKELGISTGNLTFHYPTKEHILAELVRSLFAFQWEKEETGQDLLAAYLYELAMIASVCEEKPTVKDLILAIYTSPMSLAIIRENDTKRSQKIFGAYCEGWTEIDYVLAENVASGIERAMLVTENTERVTFEQRVTSSLNAIMKLYDVPEADRKRLLAEVLATDYRSKGNIIFEEFGGFVEDKMKDNYENRKM